MNLGGLTISEFTESLQMLAGIVYNRYYYDVSDYCDYTQKESNEPNVLECKDKMINEI